MAGKIKGFSRSFAKVGSFCRDSLSLPVPLIRIELTTRASAPTTMRASPPYLARLVRTVINGSRKPAVALQYTLLTGATGLVGRYLMRDLLLGGERLAVIVRGDKRLAAHARVEAILAEWEQALHTRLPRPVVLSGSISEPNCGLSAEDRSWVGRHVGRIVHNAAVLKFEGVDRARDPWLTNVRGTLQVLELCRETGVTDLNYVSTAYVCGNRTGLVREDELDCGQSFRNDYERSKFEAEQAVRGCTWIAPPTILRPAVIAGDSRTGYTSSYHGLYLYLRLMATLVPRQPVGADGLRHTPIRLPMSGTEPRNVVPVDWVSQVICRILSRPEARGLTFHLAPDVPLTARRVVECCYSYFHSAGVVYCGDEAPADHQASDFEDEFLRSVRLYQAYDRSDPQFDRTNLLRFAGDFSCPAIDEAILHRYLRFGEQDAWGKSRRPAFVLPEFAVDRLTELQVRGGLSGEEPGAGSGLRSSYTPGIGLDILGPGGGQWRLVETGEGAVRVERGLPQEPEAPVLQLSLAELTDRLAEAEGPISQLFRELGSIPNREQFGSVLHRFRTAWHRIA